jgi:hypothetical protein
MSVITVTNDILKKLSLVGKNLDDYSLETVKMFADGIGAASNFKRVKEEQSPVLRRPEPDFSIFKTAESIGNCLQPYGRAGPATISAA